MAVKVSRDQARNNFLLGSLHEEDLGRIAAKLDRVSLALGDVPPV